MSKFYSAETQQGHSSHFVQYIRKIAEASSKQEEDQIVEEDLKALKTTLTSSTAKDEELLKEYAVRAYYAELMGHSAEFAYIHCINLSCHHRLIFKRTGYLATKLMVNPDSELMYLIVSSIQRDLKSPNYLEVSAALTAAAQMLRPELMTVVQGDLPGLITHEKPLVRRKAVEAMHAFYVRTDTAVGDVAAFRQVLCDRDPSVMDAATRLLHEVVERNPEAHRDLLDSFILILSQVIERRLPRTYEYHRTPAPWLQIRVIQLLTILIGDDPQRAQKAAHVLEEAMQRADNGKLIGFAIICELVRTAACIPQLPTLLRLSAETVSGLITSRNPNLRCAGIQALSYMVRVQPELAAEHQEVVMSCLENADETIRRKTIWLLFAICDSDNVGPIARRLIRFLSKVGDPFLKRSTTRGLCRLMEQYATSPWWYIHTMNSVLAVAAECVLPATVQRMLKLIAEGQGADEAADTSFRIRCVETYFAITGGGALPAGAGEGPPSAIAAARSSHADLECSGSGGVGSASGNSSAVPDVLRRIGAWVMGEYGFLTSKISGKMFLDRLCDLMEQTEDGETRCWILMAMMKATAHTSPSQRASSPGGAGVSDYADDIVAQYQESRCIPLQQRCYEFAALRQQPELLRRVLPKDGFCEAMEVDPELHFLDAFIETAVARGAQRYKQPADLAALRQQQVTASALQAESALRTAAYVPVRPTEIRPVWSSSSSAPPLSGEASAATASAAAAASVPSLLGQAGVDSSIARANAGLAQSVLQGSEKLVLRPTATKRWGAQNLREVAAEEEEVHLQTAAAVAVGGGGVVWGADAAEPTAAPSSSTAAAAAASLQGGSAFEKAGGVHDDGDSGAVSGTPAAAAGATGGMKPVSAKNAKFIRSIFGGGRRKGGDAASSAPKTSSADPHTVAASTSKQSTPAPPPQSNVVMDSLFATDVASPHSVASPVYRRSDTPLDWFISNPTARSSLRTTKTPPTPKSALLSALQPVNSSFHTEQFGRLWQVMGASGERKEQLRFFDISSYDTSNGFLQQHLLRACSMSVVQIIGKEIIAAAQYTTESGKEEYVLAHLNVVNSTTLSAIVRSSRRELSTEVLHAMNNT